MAEVFLAKKRGAEGTFKVLVLKRILPSHLGSRRFRAMFIEEAHLATRLNHPNVVQVYEFQDFGDEGLLLAMEYVEGCDLGRLMAAAKSKGTTIPLLGRGLDHCRGGKGPPLRPRKEGRGRPAARDRPPGREPSECPPLVRRRREDRRLRHRERAPVCRRAGSAQGQVRVHVARAGARRIARPAQRSLRARGHPLGDPGRAAHPWRPRGRGSSRHRSLGHRRTAVPLRSGRPARARGDRPQGAEPRAKRAVRDGSRALGCDRARHRQAGRGGAHRCLGARGRADQPHPRHRERAASTRLGRDRGAGANASRRAARAKPARVASGSWRRQRSSRARGGCPVLRSARVRGAARGAPRRGADAAPARPRSARAAPAHARSGSRHARRPRVQARDAMGLGGRRRRPMPSRESQRTLPARRPTRRSSRSTFTRRWPASRKISPARSRPPSASCGASRPVRGTCTATSFSTRCTIRRGISRTSSSARRPAGRTWVAGGVYRLVRRDFRWGDAPTLRLEAAARLEVPPTMRVYALERSLSREERLAEAQAGAEQSGRARRREGRPARRVPRIGGRRRVGSGAARVPRGRGRDGHRQDGPRGDLPRRDGPSREASSRRVHARHDGGPVRGGRGPRAQRDRRDGQGALLRSGRAHRARRRRGRGRRPVQPDGRSPRGAGDQPARRRRRGRARAEEEHPQRSAQPACGDRARASPGARRGGDALGGQGKPRRDRRDRARRGAAAHPGAARHPARRPRAQCPRGGDARRASRAHARRAGAPRRDAPRRARRRAAGVRRPPAEGGREPVLLARDGRRAPRAGRDRNPRDGERRGRPHLRPRAHRTGRRGVRRAALDPRAAPRRSHPRAAGGGARGGRLAGHRGWPAAARPTS